MVLDFFAVITYVTDYYAKDDTGKLEVIKQMLKESQCQSLKEKMRLVANAYLTHRPIGEAEAIFRLIPHLTLSMSNLKAQFVMLGPKDERSVRWKQATEEDLKAGVEAIQLTNREGYWFEQPDFWCKYLRRPKDLQEICFAQFAKMYQGSRAKNDDEDEENNDDESNDEVNTEGNEDEKFHFIMTHEGVRKTPLPALITLNNPRPGESKCMIKRSYPAALRYHKIKDSESLRYMLNEVMLYRPLVSEVDLEDVEELFLEEYNGRRKIDIVKNQVMEHLVGVEEARYHVEQVMKEMANEKMEEVATELDAIGFQDNEECIEEGRIEHEEYEYFNPDHANLKGDDENCENEVVPALRTIELPTDEELKSKTHRLDGFQRMVLDIAVKFAKDLVKARKPHNPRPKAPLLMVHGGAGAGKSTVIDTVANWTQKILQQAGDNVEQPYVVKTAFTGCAASNIEGHTLHGTFGFSFDNSHYSLSDKVRDKRRAAMRNLQMVIIDEISMVKSDMLYMLDLRLQEIKEKVGIPFGGIAVFVFGDMMQLKPCMGRFICEEPSNQDFKATYHLNSRWEMFGCVALEKNHRQGKDKSYADLLNRLRTADQTEEDIKLLRTRVRPATHPDVINADMYIGCIKKDVASINQNYIKQDRKSTRCDHL